MISYLDDFLVIEETKEKCHTVRDVLLQLLQQLGFVNNLDKVVGACRDIIFLGVQISGSTRTLFLPRDRLAVLQNLLTEWTSKEKVTKREL